jgi:hypothetical protein
MTIKGGNYDNRKAVHVINSYFEALLNNAPPAKFIMNFAWMFTFYTRLCRKLAEKHTVYQPITFGAAVFWLFYFQVVPITY